jgi:hypothetical protein
VEEAAAVKRLLLVLTALPLVPSAAQAVPPVLNFKCQPDPANCAAWYQAPVQLRWDYDSLAAGQSAGNCNNQTFTSDTRATKVYCEVKDDASGDITGRTVTIRLDRTGPSIAGPGLARPPDRNDWFNHPVAFQLAGQDATSGVESCTGGTYGGPDGLGVSISGSCRDVAGNVTARAFTLNYDATPPPRPTVEVLPGNHRVALRWSSAHNETEIVRLVSARSPAVVYTGAGERFTDRHLRNGRRYRYVVRLVDQAGNRSADATSAVPTGSRLLLPADGAHLRNAPKLVWKRVKRARYYNAQLLFRDQRKVLSRWPRATRLQLHERWRFQGRRHRLARGRYCWYVWPGYGPRSKRDYGRLLGKSCFTITR